MRAVFTEGMAVMHEATATKVVKVTKTSVTTEDGERWTVRGDPWGTGGSPWPSRVFLEPYDAEVHEKRRSKIQRAKNLRTISEFVRRGAPEAKDVVLEWIVSVIEDVVAQSTKMRLEHEAALKRKHDAELKKNQEAMKKEKA